MRLGIHSNVSYLSEIKSCRISVVHFIIFPQQLNYNREKNGSVHTVSNIMENVMGSSTEAEVGAFFHNFQEAELIHINLNKIFHPKPATPIQTYNSTANGIVNNIMKSSARFCSLFAGTEKLGN